MADTSLEIIPDRALPHLGTYSRDLPVNLARMYENALDWEHLPYLHAGSFKAITMRSAGDWGWHCDAILPNDAPVELELRLDRTHQRWITRTLSGLGEGSEIWSYVFERPEGGLRVVVDFFVPGVPAVARAQMLAYYTQLYAGLYDEDVSMMTGREQALAARPAGEDVINFGPEEAVAARLPLLFDLGRKPFRLVRHEGAYLAHAAQCPHMLGPLDAAEIVDGAITCPWHGYEFDVKTGTARGGQACKLAPPPNVRVTEAGDLVAEFT